MCAYWFFSEHLTDSSVEVDSLFLTNVLYQQCPPSSFLLHCAWWKGYVVGLLIMSARVPDVGRIEYLGTWVGLNIFDIKKKVSFSVCRIRIPHLMWESEDTHSNKIDKNVIFPTFQSFTDLAYFMIKIFWQYDGGVVPDPHSRMRTTWSFSCFYFTFAGYSWFLEGRDGLLVGH